MSASDPAPDADIMFLTRKWAPAIGGMESYSLRLTEEIARNEPIDVVALPGRDDGSPPSLSSLLRFPFKILRRWLSRRQTPRVLHVGDMALWPAGLLAGFAPDCQLVLSAHGTDVSYGRRCGTLGQIYTAYQKLGAFLLRDATVIANSPATAQAARDYGWRTGPVIPLASDFRPADDLQPGADAPVSLRRKILFAGRLIPQKGLKWFVQEVLPLLPAEIEIEVAGVITDPVEAQALADPRVKYRGALDRSALARAYADAVCVIVPNIERPNGEFEGFGLVACEAASAGGLVLAARTGGLVAAVLDGETGFLLPTGDASAWAERIAEVANWDHARRKAFIDRAQRTAAAHYSWSRVAAQTRSVYSGAAHG